MDLAQRSPPVGQLQPLENFRRQRIVERRQAFENPMDDHTQDPRGHFPGRFVHRDDPARVQSSILFIRRQDFEFRMHHRDRAVITIEFDLSKQRDPQPGLENVL